ncbi:hypothetical protein F3Y22_tig00111582pilonHSYRG00146 [Hibiscus syriacus]|uniref:Uncharacterized protein n=1 Tax=Hibiscus syriacus TaxID=106335 RepID=A0A6A2XLG8_HIBSY|nr:hypothetical protein F3Y22_tig00111582pilonHSYRG00146 [Hibiscus syriacus]
MSKTTATTLPNPPIAKRIVQFKPPINSSSHVDSDEDDDDEEEERRKLRESENQLVPYRLLWVLPPLRVQEEDPLSKPPESLHPLLKKKARQVLIVMHPVIRIMIGVLMQMMS